MTYITSQMYIFYIYNNNINIHNVYLLETVLAVDVYILFIFRYIVPSDKGS